MSCNTGFLTYAFNPVFMGDTWDGFTHVWSSDENAFDSDLASVRASFVNADGVAGLELESATVGEITINDASAWDYTIEPRTLSLDAGFWTIGVQTTDTAGNVKTRFVGSIQIKADPTP